MKISVVIPSYNRYTLLKRAIDSVLSQTDTVDEIIIVDDGSTDNTANIQKDFPQVKYIYQKNRGVSAARNRGVEVASSEWIAFLDSDDIWLPVKIEKQRELHTKNSKVLMSYTDELWIRDESRVKIPKKFRKIGKDAFLENLSYCNIAPSSVVIHKKLFEKYGLFDEALEVCEDYDLWLRIALFETIELLSEKLIIKYAGHDDQLSFKHWGMDRFRVKSLEKLFLQSSTIDSNYKEVIQNELINKYNLLLKGAKKHHKDLDITLYEKKLSKFISI